MPRKGQTRRARAFGLFAQAMDLYTDGDAKLSKADLERLWELAKDHANTVIQFNIGMLKIQQGLRQRRD